MATRRKEEPNTNGSGKGKIKFRYTDSERPLDSNMENVASDAVTEGLRSIANALAGRTLPVEPGRALPPGKPKDGTAAATIAREEELETPEQELPEEDELESSEESADVDGSPKPKRVVKIKAPSLLSNLKLTDAAVPLADFMKQRNPQVMLDKYAVVAVWMKEQFQITEISIDHIFTAFKHLGIESQLPTDVAKPLKNLTYTRKWFDRGEAEITYSINWLGESEVGKMGTGAVKA